VTARPAVVAAFAEDGVLELPGISADRSFAADTRGPPWTVWWRCSVVRRRGPTDDDQHYVRGET